MPKPPTLSELAKLTNSALAHLSYPVSNETAEERAARMRAWGEETARRIGEMTEAQVLDYALDELDRPEEYDLTSDWDAYNLVVNALHARRDALRAPKET